jgi:hypothetical protein
VTVALLTIFVFGGFLVSVAGLLLDDRPVFVGAGLLCLGSLLMVSLSYRFIIAYPGISLDVYWESTRYVYTAADHQMETDIVVRALRNGVDALTVKYWWSGMGTPTTEVASPGHSLDAPPEARGKAWNFFQVKFGRPLSAGETETVGLRQVLHDANTPSEPLFAKIVTEPIGQLRLEIHPPRTTQPRRVTGYEHAKAFILDPASARVLPFDEANWRISWDIRRPKLRHVYIVKWED